jgi:hypothetical protein
LAPWLKTSELSEPKHVPLDQAKSMRRTANADSRPSFKDLERQNCPRCQRKVKSGYFWIAANGQYKRETSLEEFVEIVLVHSFLLLGSF